MEGGGAREREMLRLMEQQSYFRYMRVLGGGVGGVGVWKERINGGLRKTVRRKYMRTNL